jgi:magnesium-transporting ATPase (P-type)
MAFEELWAPFAAIFMFAVFLLPIVWILDSIRQRSDAKGGKKLLLMFMMSYILAMAAYPFAMPEEMLPFTSMYTTYGLVLLFTFAVYLIAYNRTK